MNMPATPQCTICGSFETTLCSGCSSAAYCSVECQQTDSKIHERLCNAFHKFLKTPRPSPKHHLAIQFPMTSSSNEPRLLWLDSVEVAKGRFEPVLGTSRLGLAQQVVSENALRGRTASASILFIRFRDNRYVYDGFRVNETLYGGLSPLCADGRGKVLCKGSVVAYLKGDIKLVVDEDGPRMYPHKVIDINMTAYRDTIDFLSYYAEQGSMIEEPGLRTPLGKSLMADKGGKVKGVRINCVRDIDEHGHPEFEKVDVPRSHPIFKRWHPSFQMVESLKQCWIFRNYPLPEGISTAESKNWALEALLLTISPFGMSIPPLHQNEKHGSALVVNSDRSDLEVDRVRAVCMAVRSKLSGECKAFALTEEMVQEHM